VLKQILAMFFSANGPNFRATFPDLVRFVLNRDEHDLNPRIRVFGLLHPVQPFSAVWCDF
jgi:hypothetical protein